MAAAIETDSEKGTRLARAYRDGRREAFDELVDLYQTRLYRLAYRITRNSEDALDVVQDAFVRVASGIDRWDGRSSFYSWVYRVTANLAIDGLRDRTRFKKASEKRLADDQARGRSKPTSDDEAFDPEEKAALLGELRDAIDALPPAQRAIVAMRHYDGLPLREIAEIRGVAVGTVKSTLFQAFRSLTRSFGQAARPRPERRVGETCGQPETD